MSVPGRRRAHHDRLGGTEARAASVPRANDKPAADRRGAPLARDEGGAGGEVEVQNDTPVAGASELLVVVTT